MGIVIELPDNWSSILRRQFEDAADDHRVFWMH